MPAHRMSERGRFCQVHGAPTQRLGSRHIRWVVVDEEDAARVRGVESLLRKVKDRWLGLGQFHVGGEDAVFKTAQEFVVRFEVAGIGRWHVGEKEQAVSACFAVGVELAYHFDVGTNGRKCRCNAMLHQLAKACKRWWGDVCGQARGPGGVNPLAGVGGAGAAGVEFLPLGCGKRGLGQMLRVLI